MPTTATKRRTGSKKGTRKARNGDRMICDECGMEVIVDSCCDCEEVHPIVCCGRPMRNAGC